MIDISCKLSQPVIDWFVEGFSQRLKYRLLKSSKPVELEFNFEKKFYKSLYLNPQFASDFINMSPLDMEKFDETYTFKNHRLFFLLCLPLSIRQNRIFLKHYRKEMKNLPNEMSRQGLEDIASRVRQRAVKLFDYGKFGTKPTRTRDIADLTIWNAYSFLNKIQPEVCPFCNIHLTTLLVDEIDTDTGILRSRPALDHFLCKVNYPFFGVNIRNLVPSCTTCNSALKGEMDFMGKPHLNPYLHSLLSEYAFSISVRHGNELSFLERLISARSIVKDDFDIGFTSIAKVGSVRVENSVDTFELPMQYNRTKTQYLGFISDMLKVNRPFIESYVQLFGVGTIEDAAKHFLKLPENIEDTAFSALKNSLYSSYVEQKII
ncbi:hypothetical protein [Vibrio cyclitrophicus]|uniref:hypothetical protein n=1 Tax=Vibrio cyclitrophicus TaxID=47951 RepID=UPI0002F21871|nr:hypothetical protein [Vibrio cyclitrophicus]